MKNAPSIVTALAILSLIVASGCQKAEETSFTTPSSRIPSPPVGWAKHDRNPVMAGRGGNAFDLVVADPAVIHDSDGSFKMWYTASGFADGDPTPRPRVGYASSPDGVNWARADAPVLTSGPAGSWDGHAVETVWVLKVSETPPLYHMYYAGYPFVNEKNQQQDVQIGLATSSDGVSWQKSPQNPIMTIDKSYATNRWSSFGLWGAVVIKDGDLFKVWYLGVGPDASMTQMVWGIGYATSRDGISWTRNPEPILQAGRNNPFKRISDLAVLKIDSTYYLWFSATKEETDNYEVWEANSNDGIVWSVGSQDPVVPRGPSGTWDPFNAFAPSVLQIGDRLWMWYHGSDVQDPTHLKIGLAVAAAPGATKRSAR